MILELGESVGGAPERVQTTVAGQLWEGAVKAGDIHEHLVSPSGICPGSLPGVTGWRFSQASGLELGAMDEG